MLNFCLIVYISLKNMENEMHLQKYSYVINMRLPSLKALFVRFTVRSEKYVLYNYYLGYFQAGFEFLIVTVPRHTCICTSF